MRRRSAGVVPADGVVSKAIARAEAHDPDKVVRLLEPLVTPERRARLSAVIASRLASVSVVFEAPHDPHNGAAVVRSCEGFGVSTLHVIESREAFLVASSVAKSAEKWVDVRCYGTAAGAVRAVDGAGMELIAARADGEMLPSDLASVERVAIVLGNERDGIGDTLRAACRRSVRVPMRGFVESLNVSVTAAILLNAATLGRSGDLDAASRRRLYARGLYFSLTRAEDLLNGSP